MGWAELQAIGAEFRQFAEQDRNALPVACGRDGEPLDGAPDGGVFCRACGWRPDEMGGLRS